MAADGDVALQQQLHQSYVGCVTRLSRQMRLSLAAMNEAQKNAAAANVQLPDITIKTPLNSLPVVCSGSARQDNVPVWHVMYSSKQRPVAMLVVDQNGQIQVIPYDSYLTTATMCNCRNLRVSKYSRSQDQGVKVKIL